MEGEKLSAVGRNTIKTPTNPKTTARPLNASKDSPSHIGATTATTKGEINNSVNAVGIGLSLMAKKKATVVTVSIKLRLICNQGWGGIRHQTIPLQANKGNNHSP